MRVSAEVGSSVPGRLTYIESEYSFLFEPDGLASEVGGGGCLVFGTLQVELDREARVLLYVDGLHPRSKWKQGRLRPPLRSAGRLVVAEGVKAAPGVGIGITKVGEWETVYDPSNDWLRVCPSGAEADDYATEIATQTVIGVRNHCINSIWLQPTIVP